MLMFIIYIDNNFKNNIGKYEYKRNIYVEMNIMNFNNLDSHFLYINFYNIIIPYINKLNIKFKLK